MGFPERRHSSFRDNRRHRGPRHYPRPRKPPGEGEPKPRPLGRKCNPLCPYFRCNKHALVIKNEYTKGKQVKTAFCRWIGDECIGADCQYAYCALKALLPNGECMFAVRKEKKEKKDMFDELRRAGLDDKTRSLLTRRLGKFEEEPF